jgi:hypothetical protein
LVISVAGDDTGLLHPELRRRAERGLELRHASADHSRRIRATKFSRRSRSIRLTRSIQICTVSGGAGPTPVSSFAVIRRSRVVRQRLRA